MQPACEVQLAAIGGSLASPYPRATCLGSDPGPHTPVLGLLLTGNLGHLGGWRRCWLSRRSSPQDSPFRVWLRHSGAGVDLLCSPGSLRSVGQSGPEALKKRIPTGCPRPSGLLGLSTAAACRSSGCQGEVPHTSSSLMVSQGL